MHSFNDGPTTPRTPKRPWFGLFPGRSPLLGESFLFSLPAATKMFQFAAFASLIQGIPLNVVGCPIRRSADQRSFAPSRGFSQLITSFFACGSLGIHRTPFSTCFEKHPIFSDVSLIAESAWLVSLARNLRCLIHLYNFVQHVIDR